MRLWHSNDAKVSVRFPLLTKLFDDLACSSVFSLRPKIQEEFGKCWSPKGDPQELLC